MKYSFKPIRQGAQISSLKSRTAQFIFLVWSILRRPQTTGLLLVILILILLLGLLIPQQAPSETAAGARAAWVAALPVLIQPWGDLLFFLNFAQIFQSLWFWLPVALLVLHSLVALADYGFGTRQRLGKTVPPLEWQPPLARRTEHSIRLPESPQQFLETLKETLRARNFFLYEVGSADQRMIGAIQHRRIWLAPLAFYAGLLVLVSAFLVSHYFLQVDTFTLLPLEPSASSLFAGEFKLTGVDAAQGTGQISYMPARNEVNSDSPASPQELTWRLYRPSWFHRALILPTAVEPIITIEARDASGALLRLLPSQENLLPAERLHFPVAGPELPLYFIIPSANLAFQISPASSSNQNVFNVQVRRGSELAPSVRVQAQAGQAFEIDGLLTTISLNHNLKVIVRRDPALPLYFFALLLMIGGGILFWWRPPVQVWLVPEVKGRGGRLYGLMEKFGLREEDAQFLDNLMPLEMPVQEQQPQPG